MIKDKMNIFSRKSCIFIKAALICIFIITSAVCARDKSWQVRKYQFQGNTTFKSRDLLTITYLQPSKLTKKTGFSEWRLRSDVDVIRRYYRSQGFLETKTKPLSVVRDTASKKVDIVIEITEGPRTAVSRVHIDMADSIFDSSLYNKMSSRKGKYLVGTYISSDMKYLKNFLAARGFLDSKVELSVKLDSLHYLASVNYKVIEGPKIKVGSIQVLGLNKIKERYVRRELKFRNGDILTSDRISRSEHALYRTNLLNSVQIEHEADTNATEQKGRSNVTVSVTETDFFKLQTGIGYSYYGNEYKYYQGMRGHIESSYSNLFGLGHQLSADIKGSFLQQYGDLTYSTPWFFTIPVQFASKFYIDRLTKKKVDSTMVRGVELSLNYQANKNLEYVYRVKWDDMVWFSPVNVSNKPKTTTQVFGADVTYDTRNDIVDPSSGMYNLATIDVAGLFDRKSNRYIKVADYFHYFFKWNSITFGTGIQLGFIYAYDDNNQAIPPLEQFGLGGTKILRGYLQDEIRIDSGRVVKAAANLIEMRFPIIWWISGAMFVDVGNIYALPYKGNVVEDLKWCAGPGLRVKTPIAVLRMDIGFRIDKTRDYQFQFDIGQAF